MAQKKITDLQQRDNFSDTCNVPIDDTVQTYRITGPQIYDYMRTKFRTSRTISAASTALTTDDNVVFLDPTSAGFTQNLLALADVPDDWEVILKNIATNGNTVVLDGSGSETIDGNLTLTLNSMDSVTLKKTSSKWFII